VQELKIAYVNWLRENKPERLECKVERYLKDRGHRILWTPPYCPQLQPIELYWAAGKNYVANYHTNDRTMRDTIRQLRQGWYGNGDEFEEDHKSYHAPVRCHALWETCLRIAAAKFVPLVDGLEGEIGSLTCDAEYERPVVQLPIDTLVIDLSKLEDTEDLLSGVEV
jgi:hypothetical protein